MALIFKQFTYNIAIQTTTYRIFIKKPDLANKN
ncbi:hypothetical protein SAMN05216323_10656 [Williamwhitmania taraxaci]|uniref:Uncharacterized protein n=1 Tax=Williamwhitmania taraxaci TaxID=1640674 RepID=A0A1G6QRK5_9BACT|nr:hypothetical protein SAMN05216323_10656 [Williamwhitmania taraxaci]